MHDADRGAVALDDEANLSLRDQHGICVVEHRIDWVCVAPRL